jgi:hypothetical protein
VEEYLYKDFTHHLKRCVANLDPNSIPRLTSQEQEWLADTKLEAETANLDVSMYSNLNIIYMIQIHTIIQISLIVK